MMMSAVLGFALAGAPGVELVLEERQKLAVLSVLARGASAPKVNEDALAHAAALMLEAHTDLSATDAREVAAAQDLVERCEVQRRFSCWARAVQSCALLLVISASREGAADDLSLLLIDPKLARQLYDAADQKRAGWEDRLEDAIFAKSTSRTLAIDDAVASSAERIAAALYAELEPALREAKHAVAFGRIEISAALAGISIEVDGVNAGETVGAITTVKNVRPGTHTVKLSDRRARVPELSRTIAVREGDASAVGIDAPHSELRAEWIQPATFWSGVGLTALGAAVTLVTAIGTPSPEVFDACLREGCRQPAGFASLCEVTSGSTSCLRGGKGLLALPLGYSLLLTGAVWSIGATLEDDQPWISLAIGLASGVLAYSISALADHSGPLP